MKQIHTCMYALISISLAFSILPCLLHLGKRYIFMFLAKVIEIDEILTLDSRVDIEIQTISPVQD